ncbi:MAG: 16S rRNA methyltransferase [Candidatus Thorarchaeota archaeon]
MLHFILLESALELVPPELTSLKAIQKHAGRRNKKPGELLLDQSFHGQAMTRLEDGEKRGRPDIPFFSLQSILETPLCKSGLMSIHLHLQDSRIVKVHPNVRLPRNYDRFVGLIEQLLAEGRVPPTGEPLLEIIRGNLMNLVDELRDGHSNTLTLLAVESGQRTPMKELLELLPESSDVPVIIGVGMFPHGDFSSATRTAFQTAIELDKEVMMGWHVCSEILWTYTLKHHVIRTRYEL